MDPHISEANAQIQARRVADVRAAPPGARDQLVDEHTDGRQLGFLGEPGVNVLELNLALDREARDDRSTCALRLLGEPGRSSTRATRCTTR